MIIGKFAADHNGYSGYIQSVDLSFAHVTMTPVAAKQGSGPDFVLAFEAAADHDIGAAWKKTSKAGKPYLSVKLDGPTLAAPINGALIEQHNGTHVLVWSRREAEADEQAAA